MKQDKESTPKIMTRFEIWLGVEKRKRRKEQPSIKNLNEKFISIEDLNRIIDEFDFKDKDGLIMPDDECNWHIRDTHWFPDIKREIKKRVSE